MHLKVLLRERVRAILLEQNLSITVRDQARCVLEYTLPKWKDAVHGEGVIVLAEQGADMPCCLGLEVLMKDGDINEKSGCHIDPATVDLVKTIVDTGVCVVGIHLEHVVATDVPTLMLVVVDRH